MEYGMVAYRYRSMGPRVREDDVGSVLNAAIYASSKAGFSVPMLKKRLATRMREDGGCTAAYAQRRLPVPINTAA